MDVNDNAPTFQGFPYIVKVNESEMIGTKLFRVLAVDKDSGPNGRIEFRYFASLFNGKY